ncbi:MAG: type II toxin-antitoxin system RelE/ParE family toxin [Gammaproteobacteria bacterium]|nr:type II toxin-antitoxin system RelE/ParE family toxin [Gammaproteobacteria bacterium]
MLEGTRRVLRGFPKQVRIDFGTELRRLQEGMDPVNWKPMPTVGQGVREIRVSYRGQWRMIYIAKLDEAIYVLHAFQKKAQKTPKADIDVATQRLSELLQERRSS